MHAHQQTQEPSESGKTLNGVEQFESMLANWRSPRRRVSRSARFGPHGASGQRRPDPRGFDLT